jgi:hypothetical protein
VSTRYVHGRRLTRIAAGIYNDGHRAQYVVIREILAAGGHADTPHNRATLLAMLREELAKNDPTITLKVID